MLIGNTDRHFGNVTLFDRYEGPFELAPAYDMLPMLFAPQHQQDTRADLCTADADGRAAARLAEGPGTGQTLLGAARGQ